MKIQHELNFRVFVYFFCFCAALFESVSLSYFLLIQLGYTAFCICALALLHFSIMDSFNILWNNSRVAAAILKDWWQSKSWIKKLWATMFLYAIVLGFAVFLCYYYSASYFNGLLFLYTHLPKLHAYFPAILNATLLPATFVAGANVFVNAIQMTHSLIGSMDYMTQIEDVADVDRKTAVRVFGYAIAFVLACIFTEITYLSLSYGYQHFFLFTTNNPVPYLPIPMMLSVMFLAVAHTMRQIVNYVVDALFYNADASLAYWDSYAKKTNTFKFVQSWALVTYCLRGYAKGVAAAMSLTRGFAPIFIYNALDKVTGDPITSCTFASNVSNISKTRPTRPVSKTEASPKVAKKIN